MDLFFCATILIALYFLEFYMLLRIIFCVYFRNGAQLTKMETLSNRWKQFKDKLRIFKSKVEEMQCIISSNEDEACDKNNISVSTLFYINL